MRRATLTFLALAVLSGCASTRFHRYDVAISDVDGMILVPAIVSVAEAQGYAAVNLGNAAEVTLVDGTKLLWQSVEGKFVLDITLPPNVGHSPEIWMREAKATADQLFERAHR